MTYDGLGRQTLWNFPSPSATGTVSSTDYEQYGYDVNGNRTSLRKRDGTSITYAYDALNRVIQKTVPERTGLASTHTRDVYYTYDIRGLQTGARFDNTSGEGVTRTFDRYGRASTDTMTMDGVTRTLTYGYDDGSNRTSVKFPDNNQFTYAYTSGGQFNQILSPSGEVIADFNYTARNELSTIARDGTAADQTWAYDALSRLSGTTIARGAASDVTWSFTRNPASQILTQTQSNDSYAWTNYQNFSRGYTANGLNQYTAISGGNYCYDANGNLTFDGANVYLYDVENRLVEMRAMANTACPTATSGYTGTLYASLRYDPLGRLYQVTDGPSGNVTCFLYDGDALVGEYNSAGAMLKRYIHGPAAGADDPLVEYNGAAVTASIRRNLYADARGSIVLTTDTAGNTVALNTYDEYGQPGSSNAGRFQYTGQAWLAEIGMFYYKARIYSPALGRFMQVDPIGYKDKVNLYDYVSSDPLNNRDYTGLYVCKGTGSQCAAFKVFKSNLHKSAYTPRTGSMISDVRLKSADKFIGDDDGTGPSITFESEDVGATMGHYDPETNTINLDLNKINQKGSEIAAKVGLTRAQARGLVGGGVLGHEGFHGFKPVQSGDTLTEQARNQVVNEIDAYAVEMSYYWQLGKLAGMGSLDLAGRARASCAATAKAEFGGNKSKFDQYMDGC